MKKCIQTSREFTNHFYQILLRADAKKHESHGLSTGRPTIPTYSFTGYVLFFSTMSSRSDWLVPDTPVTVKLSVLLAQPRIWGIPTTITRRQSILVQ